MHLISSQNSEGALLVDNPYNREFPDRICFIDTSVEERSVTGDRKEFFGCGSLSSPDALKGGNLSGMLGEGLDPCVPQCRSKSGSNPEKVGNLYLCWGRLTGQIVSKHLQEDFCGVDKAKAACCRR